MTTQERAAKALRDARLADYAIALAERGFFDGWRSAQPADKQDELRKKSMDKARLVDERMRAYDRALYAYARAVREAAEQKGYQKGYDAGYDKGEADGSGATAYEEYEEGR